MRGGEGTAPREPGTAVEDEATPAPTKPKKPVSEWSAEEVGQWVAAADGAALPQYRATFVTNDITGDLLASLLEGTVLKDEIGIVSFGHRARLLKCIRELTSSTSSSLLPSSPSLGSSSSSSSSPPPLPLSSVSPDPPTSTSSSSSSSPSSSLATSSPPPSSSSDSPAGQTTTESLFDQSLRIGYGELQLGRVLGKGFFGEVRQGTWRGSDVAVKVIYRREFRSSDQVQLFEKEIRVLSLLRHPNIVQFLGVCTDTERCIVTELMGGGSLDDLVLSQYQVLETNPYLRTRIILNIARGMCYLHERIPPILHRDLTPKNVLLDRHYTAKVADFGLSKIGLNEKMTAAVGYLPFQAPEVFMGDDYSSKADVFSFGMLVWFIFSGVQPEKDVGSPLKMANMVAYKQHRPAMPERVAPFWRTLIGQCWAQTPDSRPTFAQIIALIQDFKLRFDVKDGEKGYLMDTLPRSAGHPHDSGSYVDDDDYSDDGGSGSSGSSGSDSSARLHDGARKYTKFDDGSGETSLSSSSSSSSSSSFMTPVYIEVPPTFSGPASSPATTASLASPLASSPPPPPPPAAAAVAVPSKADPRGGEGRPLRVRRRKLKSPSDKRGKNRPGMTQRLVVIGNSCTDSGVKAVPYEWTIYVKGINNEDVSPFIKHVTFVLHPSFDPREVEIHTPPYQLRRRGWGTFEIGVVITFKDGQTLRFRHQLDFSGRPTERLYDLSFPSQLLLPSFT